VAREMKIGVLGLRETRWQQIRQLRLPGIIRI
jgi:hypothetical protein